MKPNTPVAQEIYFSFLQKASRPNPNGECPIVFRIIYRRQRKDVFTGLAYPPNMWMKEERSVSRRFPTAISINHQLHRILADAEHHFNRLKFIGEEFTLDDLVNEMKGNTPPPQTLQEYIDLKEAEMMRKRGMEISVTTWYKYRRIFNYLREFIKVDFQSRKIPVSKIDTEFINNFYRFLRQQKKNSHNSCSALMCCLKAILLPAVKNRIIRSNPFDTFIMKREQRERGFLEKQEIIALERLDGLSHSLTLKRDAFLFAILLNGVINKLGVLGWHDFINLLANKETTPSRKVHIIDILWLFIAYPFLLGLAGVSGNYPCIWLCSNR